MRTATHAPCASKEQQPEERRACSVCASPLPASCMYWSAHSTTGNVVSRVWNVRHVSGLGSARDYSSRLSRRRAVRGTRTKGRGQSEEGGPGGKAARARGRGFGRGAAAACGPDLRRELGTQRRVRARRGRGRELEREPCRWLSVLLGPLALGRDAGESGARRGREVVRAGAANAKLAGAAVPVRARGRAAPLAPLAALPAAPPLRRARRGR